MSHSPLLSCRLWPVLLHSPFPLQTLSSPSIQQLDGRSCLLWSLPSCTRTAGGELGAESAVLRDSPDLIFHYVYLEDIGSRFQSRDYFRLHKYVHNRFLPHIGTLFFFIYE